jgi:hypothetical protein
MKITTTLFILAFVASSMSLTAQDAEKLTFDGLTEVNDTQFEENGINWTVGGGSIAIGGGNGGGNGAEFLDGEGILFWDKEIDITGFWFSSSNGQGCTITFRDKDYQTITSFDLPFVNNWPPNV